MDPALREMFDEHVETVVQELPQHVRAMLEEVPLIVEDRPTAQVLDFLELDAPIGSGLSPHRGVGEWNIFRKCYRCRQHLKYHSTGCEQVL